MEKTAAEQKFEEYREYLLKELNKLASYIRLFRRLHERRLNRLDEMNVAPGFFQTTISALFTAIVLWVDKLLGERSERGLMNFLAFVENNCEMLKIKELKRRRNYPDDHWMLDREPIDFHTTQSDREKIRKLESLPNFKLMRDKYHAHFDKEYFFDQERLQDDAPLKWSDLEEVIQVGKDILNTYSAAYDGNLYEVVPDNATDVDVVLDILHRQRRRKK